MCGIAGLIDPTLSGQPERLSAIGGAMASALAHRGPDGSGVWTDEAAGLVLSQRRLAVIDLSSNGDQPMVSADGRWVINFNGEIYNAAEMAQSPELRNCQFRGHSDTEVILESFARRGVAKTLSDINGMFAIALWDRAERTLYLIRDHMGIKPLFVLTNNRRIAFASELKSLATLDRPRFEIDLAAVTSFFRFGCIPAPYCVYRGISKLRPGEMMVVPFGAPAKRQRYWSVAEAAFAGISNPLEVSDHEAIEEFSHLLGDAVSRQMISDVPIGAFLSGGVDSSTVASFMVRAAKGPVRTFSIGSPDLNFDESKHAAAVALHLGTIHTEMTVTADDALDVIPALPTIYDEPFADSSQIPTYLISKLTRRHVTVALTGDGGDELLGGYNRHVFVDNYWKYLTFVPVPLRSSFATLLRLVPERALGIIEYLLPYRRRPALFREKLRKLIYVIPVDSRELYIRLVSLCFEPSDLTGVDEPTMELVAEGEARLGSLLAATQLRDMMLYLPDDILQKVDRASMAVSLEVRPPLLDHRVVELSWRLPNRFKVRKGDSKWLLRRVLERYVPRYLIDRPKMGFSVPLESWLRGPLRKWSEELLDPASFGGGILNANAARRMHQDFLSGLGVSAHAIWTLVMFEAWRRKWAA